MRWRKTSGYTLIEAMVVVSIIVLLFAIMFPVFQQVKWKVKQTRSISNMKQIHMAVMIYAQDYEGSGIDGLGLPPDMTTLKLTQRLPQGLLETGGVPWVVPGHPAVFTWMPPAGPAYNDLIQPWMIHVENTNGSPILLIDESFNHGGATFVTLQGHGIYLDGHVERRRARGGLARYDLWE